MPERSGGGAEADLAPFEVGWTVPAGARYRFRMAAGRR